MSNYAVWPDGCWCEFHEIEEMMMSGWSDDFYLTDTCPETDEEPCQIRCPVCDCIVDESNETEVSCGDCKCVVLQLPIRINGFNHKGGDHGIYT